MNWKLTEQDIARFPAQQKQVQRYELARHLLTLPLPPENWSECEQWLIVQCEKAELYGISETRSLKLFIESTYLMPSVLDETVIKKALNCSGSEYFKAEQMLVWVEQKIKQRLGAN